jgi:hypothetical protein
MGHEPTFQMVLERPPVRAEILEQHGEVGDREHLAPAAQAVQLRALRGTYEVHVDDHWRG